MSVVEKVSAAIRSVAYLPIAEKMRDDAKENGLPPPEGTEINEAWTTAQARAAIAAMREPDETMIEAMNVAFMEWELDGYKGPLPPTIYRAAIDAALREGRG